MEAAEVLLTLLTRDLHLPPDYRIEFLRHNVGRNWRERFTTPGEQIGALDESLVHEGPFTGERWRVGDLGSATIFRGTPGVALSVTSRVWNERGEQFAHLAFMNLHPAGFDTVAQLQNAVLAVTEGITGYLISSGRCALRLTACPPFKPEVPRLVGTAVGQESWPAPSDARATNHSGRP